MTKRRVSIPELEAILANQRASGNGSYGSIAATGLSSVLIVMFYLTSTRLTEVEVLAKQLTVERLFDDNNNYEEAVAQYKSIASMHETPAILARLGILYFQLDPKGNEKIALDTLEKARNLDPNYWETYRYLTYIYTVNGKAAEAIKSGEEGLKHNKYDAKLYNNLAWIYATSGEPLADLQRAQQYAERARDLTRPKYLEVLDTLRKSTIAKAGENRRQVRAAPQGRCDVGECARPTRSESRNSFPTRSREQTENGTMTKLYTVVGLAMFIATLVSAIAMAGPSP